MPICQIKTNFKMSETVKKSFTDELAEEMSILLEKPIAAVMVMLSDEYMYMNRSEDTVLFAEFRYVKKFADEDEKKKFFEMFSVHMLDIMRKYTSVAPYRVYMQFTEMHRDSAWRYIEEK